MGRDYREEKNMVDDKDTKRKKLFRTTNDKSCIIINNDWNNIFTIFVISNHGRKECKKAFRSKKVLQISLFFHSLLIVHSIS